MNITLLVIGKTNEKYLTEGIDIYSKRLVNYTNFNLVILADVKNAHSLTHEQLKQKEGELIMNSVKPSDNLILLDDKGKHYSSMEFSEQLNKFQVAGIKQLTFVVGGAFGFSDEVYKRANAKISLSKMTFSHQMVRLFFVEQLYRAFTILKGEKYHHE